MLNYDLYTLENFTKLFYAGLESGESDFSRVNAGVLEILGMKVDAWGTIAIIIVSK